MVAFNYRGYSESEGKPNIKNIKEDGLVVARFVRNFLAPGAKLGAHGTSIGGSVANFLARQPSLIDFVFIDRSFGSLDSVAEHMCGGRWAAYGLKFLSGVWDTDSCEDYIYSNCYKVIGQDAGGDEIIPERSSLMRAVA